MNNINLLPPAEKKILAFERLQPLANLLLSATTIILVLIYLFAHWQRITIERKIATQYQPTNLQREAINQFDQQSKEIKDLSQAADSYYQVIRQQRAWPALFIYLRDALPADVYLKSIGVSGNNASTGLSLNGIASNRQQVGIYREKLLYYQNKGELGEWERVSAVNISSIAPTDPANPTGPQNFAFQVTIDLSPNLNAQE